MREQPYDMGYFPGVLRRRFVGATISLFGVDKLLFCSSSDDLTSPYVPKVSYFAGAFIANPT